MFTTEVVITEDEYGFKIRPAEIDDSKSFKLTGDRNTQVTFSSATAKEKIGDHDYEIDNEVLTLTKR